MKFHHIGIATESIKDTLEKLASVMNISEKSEILYDELQDATLCMIKLEEGIELELIEGNVVKNYIKKRQYLYHTCYSTTNIEKEVQKLESLGALLVRESRPAKLFNGRKVAFLMWDIGLIELVEEG